MEALWVAWLALPLVSALPTIVCHPQRQSIIASRESPSLPLNPLSPSLCFHHLSRSAATGVSGQMLQSALRRWLNASDALLGPWQMGRDPLERALYSFEGVVGGPHVHPWQAGSRTGIGYAMEEDGAEAGSSGSGGTGRLPAMSSRGMMYAEHEWPRLSHVPGRAAQQTLDAMRVRG